MTRFEKRISVLRSIMAEKSIDAFFLPPTGELEYVTGIRRQRPNPTQSHLPGGWLYGAYLTEDHLMVAAPKMVSGFVQDLIAEKNLSFIDEVMILEENRNYEDYARDIIKRFKLENKSIAVPNHGMPQTLFTILMLFPALKFKSASDIIEKMRMVKDAEEIDIMRKAAQITDKVYAEVLKKLKVGMTEEEIATEVDWQILQQGGEGVSFITGIMCQGETTVAGYKEGVGRSGKTKLTPGQTLAFDFGLVYDGYVSDFGRTVYVGEPSSEAEKIHHLIMGAQESAIKAMISGQITAGETDAVARNIIIDAGYGEAFFHRLGHGIGIDVHEPPFLTASDSTVLESGMTFTVEPSTIVPGKAWIRVEDVVLVTESGGDCLNKARKDIVVIN